MSHTDNVSHTHGQGVAHVMNLGGWVLWNRTERSLPVPQDRASQSQDPEKSLSEWLRTSVLGRRLSPVPDNNTLTREAACKALAVGGMGV